MRYPFNDFQPARAPEAVLAQIRRKVHMRRSRRTATLGLAVIALCAAFFLRAFRPDSPPPGFVVQKAWSGSEEVPYIVYTSDSGRSIIFIQSRQEVHR